MQKKRTYGEKRKSGNMMYGPTMPTAKYPHFVSGSRKCLCDHKHHREKGMTYAQCEKEKERAAKFANGRQRVKPPFARRTKVRRHAG